MGGLIGPYTRAHIQEPVA